MMWQFQFSQKGETAHAKLLAKLSKIINQSSKYSYLFRCNLCLLLKILTDIISMLYRAYVKQVWKFLRILILEPHRQGRSNQNIKMDLLVRQYIMSNCRFKFSTEIYKQQQYSDREQNRKMEHVQIQMLGRKFFSCKSAFSLVSQSYQNHQIIKQGITFEQNQMIAEDADNVKSSIESFSTLKSFTKKSSAQLQKISLQGANTQESDIKSNSQKQGIVTKEYSRRNYSTRLRDRKPLKYDFDSENQDQQKQSRPCETKNIIKNFIRSVLSFIRKNERYSKNLLRQFQIEQEQFQKVLEKVQGKVNTIAELRQLWVSSKYEKVFRVLSSHFLRKYYPRHIFHSRIFNYQIHLKYRVKLLRSLQRPEEFSSLKQF